MPVSREVTSGATSGATQVATEEDLRILWQLFMADCLAYIRETPSHKLNWKRLYVIRAFLKDNGMTIDSAHVEDVAASLKKLQGMALPFRTEKPSL